MAYLFDTDAISELLRRRPAVAYVRWLNTVPRVDQFTSAVVVGELYQGAFRSPAVLTHLENIETRVLPSVTVLSYEVATARLYGEIRAQLEDDHDRWWSLRDGSRGGAIRDGRVTRGGRA